MTGNHFCHICGGLVDLIKLQPSGVRFCECEKRFTQLRAENSALKAELAEAKKDADRLDWLQVHDKRFYNIDKIAAIVGSGFSCSGYKTRHTDIRNAIDEAMKGK